MKVFAESRTYRPASWRGVVFKGVDRRATLTCLCGAVYALRSGMIGPSGITKAPLRCSCGFDDLVRLEGWEAGNAGGKHG